VSLLSITKKYQNLKRSFIITAEECERFSLKEILHMLSLLDMLEIFAFLSIILTVSTNNSLEKSN